LRPNTEGDGTLDDAALIAVNNMQRANYELCRTLLNELKAMEHWMMLR
jgi:hypothetical protein